MKKLDIVKQARFIHVTTSLLFGLAGIFLLAWPEIATTVSRYLIGSCFKVREKHVNMRGEHFHSNTCKSI